MKKLLISIITLGTIAFLSSCGTTDTKPAPTISAKFDNVTGTSITRAAGETIAMTIEYKTGEDFSKLEVTETSATGSVTTEIKPTSGKFTNNQEVKFSDIVLITSTYTFKVTDSKNGSATSAPIEVKVSAVPEFNAALENTSVVLTSNRSAAFATGSTGSFYSITSKSNGNSSLASSDFKLLDKNTLVAGAADMFISNEGVTNKTKFQTTTIVYATATASEVDSAVAPTLDDVKITAGSTYLFVTSTGTKGLIKVEGLSSSTVTAGGTTSNATLMVKVLK